MNIEDREGDGSDENDGAVNRSEDFGGRARIFVRGLLAEVRFRGPTASR